MPETLPLDNKSTVNRQVNWVMVALLIAVIEDCFGGLYYFTRVFFVPEIAHLNKLVTGSVIMICLFALIRQQRFSVGVFSWLMVFGLMVGLVNTLVYSENITGSSLFSHLSHWVVMFVCFTAARSVSWDLERLAKGIKQVAVLALTLNGIFFVVLDFTRRATGKNVYVGSSAEELLIPFTWFLAAPNVFIAGLAAILILLSGKRGPLVAILAIITWFVFFKKFRNGFLSATMKSLVLGSIVVCFVGYGLVVYKPSTMLDKGSVLQRAVYKTESSVIRVVGKSENRQKSLDLATSGRSAEFSSAWNKFTETPFKFIFGNGYGWDLDIYLFDGSSTEKTHLRYHFLHFSPLNIALLYGVFFLLLYYVCIYRIVAKNWRCLKRLGPISSFSDGEKVYAFLLFLLLGKLVVSLTAYNVGVDPVLWIVMGILARPDLPSLALGNKSPIKC